MGNYPVQHDVIFEMYLYYKFEMDQNAYTNKFECIFSEISWNFNMLFQLFIFSFLLIWMHLQTFYSPFKLVMV